MKLLAQVLCFHEADEGETMAYEFKDVDGLALGGLLIKIDFFKLIVDSCEPDAIENEILDIFLLVGVVLFEGIETDSQLWAGFGQLVVDAAFSQGLGIEKFGVLDEKILDFGLVGFELGGTFVQVR